MRELYVFTHSGPPWRDELKKRFDAILATMDKGTTWWSVAPVEGRLQSDGVTESLMAEEVK